MSSTGLAVRVETQRPFRARAWFTTMADERGRDDRTGLEVDVDPTGWVTDVRLAEPSPELRSPEGLEAAVRRAVGEALLVHLARSASERTLTEAERQRARDLLDGRTRLDRPRVTRSPQLVRPAEPFTPPTYHADERLARQCVGSSQGGELRVTMSVLSGLVGLDADAEFLRTADADLLRHALREAFADAGRTADRTAEEDR
jgi:hypothetical protein